MSFHRARLSLRIALDQIASTLATLLTNFEQQANVVYERGKPHLF